MNELDHQGETNFLILVQHTFTFDSGVSFPADTSHSGGRSIDLADLALLG